MNKITLTIIEVDGFASQTQLGLVATDTSQLSNYLQAIPKEMIAAPGTIMPSVIGITNTPDQICIRNGLDERRYTFTLSWETTDSRGMKSSVRAEGYSDFADTSLSGLIPPETTLYFTSIRSGDTSSAFLAGEGVDAEMVLQRPTDIFVNKYIDNMEWDSYLGYQGQQGGTSNTLGVIATSPLDTITGSGYNQNLIKTLSSSLATMEGDDVSDVYARAASIGTLAVGNKLIDALSEFGINGMSHVTLSDLYAIDPYTVVNKVANPLARKESVMLTTGGAPSVLARAIANVLTVWLSDCNIDLVDITVATGPIGGLVDAEGVPLAVPVGDVVTSPDIPSTGPLRNLALLVGAEVANTLPGASFSCRINAVVGGTCDMIMELDNQVYPASVPMALSVIGSGLLASDDSTIDGINGLVDTLIELV